jgi:hypothetical protein
VRGEVDVAAYERLTATVKDFDAGQAHARAGRWLQAVAA